MQKDEFKVQKYGRLYSVSCRTCFIVSSKGTSARRPKARLETMRQVRDWLNTHEHTQWRSLESAHRECGRISRELHPDVAPEVTKRLQTERVEKLGEVLLKRRSCFICMNDSVRSAVRNNPSGNGVLVLVVCKEHEDLTSETWTFAEPMTGMRVPE